MNRRRWIAAATALSVALCGPAGADDAPDELAAGIRLVQEKSYAEAVIALDAVARRLAEQPEGGREAARARLYLGAAHLGLGQKSEARAQLIQAVRLDRTLSPDPSEFSKGLLRLYAEAREQAWAQPRGPRAEGLNVVIVGIGLGLFAATGAVIALSGGPGGDPALPEPFVRTFSGLEPEQNIFYDVSTPIDATLAVSVDWTLAANDLDIYLFPTSCIVPPSGTIFCAELAADVSADRKPANLRFTGPAGTYRLVIRAHAVNRGAETGSLRVEFSR